VELHLAADGYREAFAADLPVSDTSAMAVAQRPIAASAFEERSTAPAWRTLPCWFVIAADDRAIHPDAQRFMAHRADADVVELAASHSVARSRPAEVAAHLRRAALSARARAHR
jgi:hypothetical protein